MQDLAVTANIREADAGVQMMPLWKRALDLALVVLLLPGLLLAALFATLVIKLTSTGPILFCQERVGYRGRRFKIYKFRTMRHSAEIRTHQNYMKELIHSDKPMAKLDAKHDPRLIPLGAILRATGIDELPQVINVLKGEMSFVGPRPCVPYEYEQYEPRHQARLNAVPGLTGLWQVNGKNRTTFERMVQLDVAYAQNLSLWLDLSIIMRTFGALVGQCRDLRDRRKTVRQPLTGTLSAVEAYNLEK